MLTPGSSAPLSSELYKNVHSRVQNVRDLPFSAVCLDVLKVAERRLVERGLITKPTPQTFHDLWFVAETERNVYLWRNGFSIDDAIRFDFWICVPSLIEKRLAQLNTLDVDNPFRNPLWGLSSSSPAAADQEIDYLTNLRAIFGTIAPHAHALARIAHELRVEASTVEPTIVLLPSQRAPVEEPHVSLRDPRTD